MMLILSSAFVFAIAKIRFISLIYNFLYAILLKKKHLDCLRGSIMTHLRKFVSSVPEYRRTSRGNFKHLKGEETSTNSVATIFAWTGALKKRGELDSNAALSDFAEKLEKACIKTIEDGKMTKDLALITTNPNPVVLNSEDFIKAIRTTLEESLK